MIEILVALAVLIGTGLFILMAVKAIELWNNWREKDAAE